MRHVPLVMPYQELLRENGPEMKCNIVKFRPETGQHQIHRKLPKAQHRFLNIVEMLESVSSNMCPRPTVLENIVRKINCVLIH